MELQSGYNGCTKCGTTQWRMAHVKAHTTWFGFGTEIPEHLHIECSGCCFVHYVEPGTLTGTLTEV